MGMVAEEDQSLKGLVGHLSDAIQLDEMLIELISNFYSQSQKNRETEDTFVNDLQVLARKIIAWKPSFHLESNHQLKAQHAHKLQDPYYAAMALSALQSSSEEETFIKFWGCLVTMFRGQAKQSKSSVASTGIDVEISEIKGSGCKLSKIPDSIRIRSTSRRLILTACKIKMNN